MQIPQTKTILDAETSAGFAPEGMATAEFSSVALQLSADGGIGTVKVYGYVAGLEYPETESEWIEVQVIDVNDGTPIDGITGISLADGDVKLVEINTDHLTWMTVELVSASGAVTAVATASNVN